MIPVIELPTSHVELMDHGWVQIGAGCSRVAYENPNKPGIVLKNSSSRVKDNQRECDIWEEHCESFFSFCLTPILGRTEDYSSILMKKATVMDWRNTNDAEHANATSASNRDILNMWSKHFNMKFVRDFHLGNWGQISDDYGMMIPGPLVDYAGT